MAKKTTTTHSKNDQKETSPIAENTKFEIKIDAARGEAAYQKTLVTLSRRLKLDGFRKGKVPPHIAEQHLGESDVLHLALEDIISEVYQETVESLKKHPLTQPDLKIISLKRNSDWILQAEIAEHIHIELDNFRKDVEKALQAAKKQWKETSEARKKGKESEIKSENEQKHQERSFLLGEIYRALVTTYRPQIPELMLRREVEQELHALQHQLEGISMSLDDFLKRRNLTPQELSEQIAAEALARLQLQVILGEIAEKEKMTVSDKEVEAYLQTVGDSAALTKAQQDVHYFLWVKESLLKQKITDLLLSL